MFVIYVAVGGGAAAPGRAVAAAPGAGRDLAQRRGHRGERKGSKFMH